MAESFVSKRGHSACLALFVLAICGFNAATSYSQTLAVGTVGDELAPSRAEAADRIDFSHCGYAGANEMIPDVPVRIVVEPGEGGDGERVQAAIDSVARMPMDDHGFRGAVLLAPGHFEVSGQLRITHSGIVLRGSGAGTDGTTVVATGQDRRSLVRVEGQGDRRPHRERKYRVLNENLSAGAYDLQLDSVAGLHVGDAIFVTRPSTAHWIKTLGMDVFGIAWKPGTRDIRWDRTIRHINGDTITIDAPITTAIEGRFGGATVELYEWPGRITHIGIEDLTLQSAYDPEQPHDEQHAWFGVTMQNVKNAWVRRVEFRHFAGGAVSLWENTTRITVEDCLSLKPISEVGGYRRHTFFTQGQLSLFLRCWSEQGRHDFAVGHCSAGPNAFVNCFAADALGDSGPIESWASGVLYDNVRIEGAGLNLENRWTNPPGAGWSAGNCTLWQCQAATMRVFRPPTANNWAIGAWASFAGDGTFQARSEFVKPISLYQGQLSVRRGTSAAAHLRAGLVDPIGSTNPTLAEAAKFAAQSRKPRTQLIDVIRENFNHAVADRANVDTAKVATIAEPPRRRASTRKAKLAVQNGWLVVDGALKTGGLLQQGFWRGTVRPDDAPNFGMALTRYVPGRVGPGFTDDLDHVASHMLSQGVAVFDHHYGLWYDRRRDDHTTVRQADADVAPPFYEQPIARSGVGRAWDGLSNYDLAKFNRWYWNRLRDFARLCDDRGLVLFHQNYFQHNILEAAAHWADCPWRPANNVNDTGLPEPPPYIGDKRIFMAQQFYDITNPRLRELHRGYIRQCLDNFVDASNVIQMTSAEFSGPLEFTRFWLDTIIEWQREHGRDILVALSAPKDVQDAILADPARAPFVDIIDIRYWAYTADNELYAPEGGRHLAPRQHLRQTRLKPGGFAAIVKAVREYRSRYPDKAVTYYADLHCPSGRDGWAVLMGGGSLPNVKLPDRLAKVIPALRPTDGVVSGKGQWCLAGDGYGYLIYAQSADRDIRLTLRSETVRYRVHWLDSESGDVESGEMLAAGQPLRLRPKANVMWLEPAQAD